MASFALEAPFKEPLDSFPKGDKHSSKWTELSHLERVPGMIPRNSPTAYGTGNTKYPPVC